MQTLHRRCAGLDVHSDSVVVCARLTVRTKASHEVRRFSTATRDLLELADWLAAQGITHVAMEATGIYWNDLAHPGGQVRTGARECRTHSQCSRRQERRQRRGVDLRPART